MAKIKMTLQYPTVGKKAGETIEVDDAETADRLEANGSAVRAQQSAKD